MRKTKSRSIASLELWRREGDSNPQGLLGRTGFRDRLLSQFGHPSGWYARLDLNQRPSAPEADALIR